jgi:hypothetical protein
MQEKKEHNPVEDLYVEPRLGIKGASIQIIDSFIDVIVGFLEEDPVQELSVRFFLYTDGSETVFIVNDNSVVDLPAHPVGDFFDEVPDLLITITASTDSPGGLTAGKSDAIYMHDPDNIDDVGEIELYISLPTGPKEIIDYFTSQRTILCGVLTHEMQHVVQKMICGHVLPLTTGEDLDIHAFNPREVDARVEESITLMGDDEPEDNENLFSEALKACIDEYLERNTDPETADKMRGQMLVEHMLVYKKKMQALL